MFMQNTNKAQFILDMSLRNGHDGSHFVFYEIFDLDFRPSPYSLVCKSSHYNTFGFKRCDDLEKNRASIMEIR